jgi:ATP-dependent Clp protease ATP-binding subunit ClpB
MDKLDRRLIQLQIEREAVKREKDEASQKRLELINEEITACKKKLPTWTKSGSARRPGPRQRPGEGRHRQAALPDRRTHPQGRLAKVASCNTASCPSWKNSLKEAQAKKPAAAKRQRRPAAAHPGGRGRNCRGGQPRHRHPVAKMMQGEKDKLLQMEGKLHERVVGQNEAIAAVSNAIRRSRSGLSRPQPPHGLVFVPGPHRRGQNRAVQGAGGLFV